MTTGMLHETVQTSPSGSGPRFRPYASPNHHVTKGRYITSNDPRGYIPVYEYPLNGQWIMMDIDDGYILWTGIWKALGNSKADIVKMIDSQPDLAPLIRRVRGGYLKIQGTWMPYEVALKLSRRVAWSIRDDLIPLFGPTFPSTCLSPEQPGYGQVVPSGQGRRRARRSTQNSVMQMPRAPAGWTVVTPNISSPPARELQPSLHPASLRTTDYPLASPYPPHARGPVSPDMQMLSPSLSTADSSHLDHHRYGGSYSSYPPTSYRKLSAPSKTGLSLDIRSLSVRERSSEPSLKEDFKLPPIHGPNGSDPGDSPYALPPISAMEDLRGSLTQDSAAVLRRLRMDDDQYPKAGRTGDDQAWARRHSLSVHPSSSKPLDMSPRFQPYNTSRSYQEQSGYRGRSPSTSSYGHNHNPPQTDAHPVWSDASHEGDSTSNPSPTSPTTPSSLSENEDRSYPQNHYDGSMIRGKPLPAFTGRLGQQQWPPVQSHADAHGRISEADAFPVRRNSYEVQSDGDSNHPHRPW
ncbi:hypothetical protein GALMADRAFT_117937 [Galerina marginata CBS 339.88]|uniref:HTH APSES-type domain-containing protein n=1 Tax=Galerina marginata (strain CBS 339.88) TaxID=685588 RepID=A0A067T867_GALM3|nr:hypothetical protein GALMADRAFT_117937 [Galerina marginata CBS 339.88]